MKYENSSDYAQLMDQQDPMRKYREEFYIPEKAGKEAIYLCGNSLGLQPKACEQTLLEDLYAWRKYGVDGHMQGDRPWIYYHEHFSEPLAAIVGARSSEVVAMNNLTINIHLLLVSFYQPKGKRRKILIESQAFSSDIYAVYSYVQHLGLDPKDIIVEIDPTNGELYETDKICDAIRAHGDELSLVFLGGLNYYTGQLFDMESITKTAHACGAKAGYDLAHAVGNAPLNLHDWDVDFAAWCSYKYLNSGPGGVSGVFINERYVTDKHFPRLAGWWGQREEIRFQMQKEFDPTPTAEGWMVSNSGIFNMTNLLASLEVFKRAGIEQLRVKSIKLTGYLEYLIHEADPKEEYIKMITPSGTNERGCQLSMFVFDKSEDLFNLLTKKGVILDWRRPDVIRVSPAPLYNSFMDVYNFYKLLVESMKEIYE